MTRFVVGFEKLSSYLSYTTLNYLAKAGILKERLWPLITTDDILKYMTFNITVLHLYLRLVSIAVLTRQVVVSCYYE